MKIHDLYPVAEDSQKNKYGHLIPLAGQKLSLKPYQLWLRELTFCCYQLYPDGRHGTNGRLILHCPHCGDELSRIMLEGDTQVTIFICDRCSQELFLPKSK